MTAILRDLILTKKHFLLEHRYDPFEIYSDEFEDELKAIPDPKKEPIECLDQFLTVLDEFGPWCADRAALNLIAQIEKSKVKTPYERHYLLLCLVSTTLIQIRAFCEQTFQRFSSDKECIEAHSSPKALRLLDILRQFKPEKPPESNAVTEQQAVTSPTNSQTAETEKVCKLPENDTKTAQTPNNSENVSVNICDQKSVNDIAPKSAVEVTNSSQNDPKATKLVRTVGGKKTKGGLVRQPRQYNNAYQNDPNALCGLLLCNSIFTAKILFSFIYEMTKHDPDLKYLSVQYTGPKVADPITESKQFENEHRKQEEVLKRFRMHSCNLLIGTSVLEEGIELPKCNLVIRWNLPTTYRSYVHCKGRARAQRAFHIIMVAGDATHCSQPNEFLSDENHQMICEKDENATKCFKLDELKKSLDESSTTDDEEEEEGGNEDEDEGGRVKNTKQLMTARNFETMKTETENIVRLIAQYMQIERILLRKCSNQEPSIQDLADADLYTDFIRPYKPIQSMEPNTPFVNLATAVVLVNKYCAKLPSDTFTKLTPLWRCCKTNRANRAYYQYTVRFPINSPVKQDIYVSKMSNADKRFCQMFKIVCILSFSCFVSFIAGSSNA